MPSLLSHRTALYKSGRKRRLESARIRVLPVRPIYEVRFRFLLNRSSLIEIIQISQNKPDLLDRYGRLHTERVFCQILA
jgi:hypothetical protein